MNAQEMTAKLSEEIQGRGYKVEIGINQSVIVRSGVRVWFAFEQQGSELVFKSFLLKDKSQPRGGFDLPQLAGSFIEHFKIHLREQAFSASAERRLRALEETADTLNSEFEGGGEVYVHEERCLALRFVGLDREQAETLLQLHRDMREDK
jgi:hypothetical protein